MSFAPENTFEGKNIYVGTTTATVTVDVRKYKRLAFSLSGLSGETVTLDISMDGNVWFTGMMPTLLTTNANAGSTALVNGVYSFGGGALPCAYVRWTKSAAVSTLTIAYGLGN